MFEYAEFLRSREHNVTVLVQKQHGALAGMLEVTEVPDFSSASIPESDIIIATTPREVRQAYDAKRGEVVHFCQGYEITDLEQRIAGKVLPPRYRGTGFFNSVRIARKKKSWKRKLERTDAVYRLPTHLVTVSKHLKSELESRYSRKVKLCENGVRRDLFYPAENFTWSEFSEKNPMRIINIGPRKVTFKGIDTTLQAIRQLKDENLPVCFIRVAPKITDEERSDSTVDEFYENIPATQLAELLRSSHVYISNSTEGEGFGLPALEALSSGLLTVLSSISSYRNFADGKKQDRDFALFVPEGDVAATTDAVRRILHFTPEKACGLRNESLKVAERFSFKKSCSEFERILTECLKKDTENV